MTFTCLSNTRKALKGILLKEQESERMEFETAIYEKQVKNR